MIESIIFDNEDFGDDWPIFVKLITAHNELVDAYNELLKKVERLSNAAY